MKLTPASGAVAHPKHKGDMQSTGAPGQGFMLEQKDTDKKSFSITSAIWGKLLKEAFAARKKPVLRISFGDGHTVYCLTESDFKHFKELVEKEFQK